MKWYSKYLPVYEKPFAEVPAETVAEVRAKLAERQSDRPLATVSVIACNEEKRLTACLWSLAEQRCRYPMEIIATDNLSKDRTAEIFETLGLPWQRETTPGCGHARLCGLNRARGKYHINHDADTIYPPRYVETMVDALERRAADPAVDGPAREGGYPVAESVGEVPGAQRRMASRRPCTGPWGSCVALYGRTASSTHDT